MSPESELYLAQYDLRLNQARQNKVRDTMARATREWDELQAERKGILARLVEVQSVGEYTLADSEGEALPPQQG